MKLKNYFFTAVLTMMFAACSVNEDNPSGDIPVPTESYETVLNYIQQDILPYLCPVNLPRFKVEPS